MTVVLQRLRPYLAGTEHIGYSAASQGRDDDES